MRPIRIVLISDIHISEAGQPIWNTDTLKHFDNALTSIQKIEGIDAIIVSGDIADKGTQWAYNYVRESLDNLKMPIFLVPGNHDNLEIFTQEMSSCYCHVTPSLEIREWKFIFLNTVLPDSKDSKTNMGRGYLSYEQLNSLDIELDTTKNVCIVMHHPPIEPEGWLNRKILENRSELENIINKHKTVKLILYGHTHSHSLKCQNGIIYICAPSIGFAFNKDLPKFQIDNGEEGFLIIDLYNNEINCIKKSLYE